MAIDTYIRTTFHINRYQYASLEKFRANFPGMTARNAANFLLTLGIAQGLDLTRNIITPPPPYPGSPGPQDPPIDPSKPDDE